MSETYRAVMDGHRVEVRAWVELEGGMAGHYVLSIDGRDCDRAKAVFRSRALKGALPDGRAVEALVRQGLLGTRYTLTVGGVVVPFEEDHVNPARFELAEQKRKMKLALLDVSAGALVTSGGAGLVGERFDGGVEHPALWGCGIGVGFIGFLVHAGLPRGLWVFAAAHAVAAGALFWSLR